MLNLFKKKDSPTHELLGMDKHLSDDEVDKLYTQAINIILESGMANASILQRKMSISWDNASHLISKMEEDGIVGQFDGVHPRKILISASQSANFLRQDDLLQIDKMDGEEFEDWCAQLLTKCGFTNVKRIGNSGDQGVDIIAVKNEIHYAIQCKCYSSNLGNSPVQEVYAGKEMYDCQVAVVMTNRYFTSGARQLAEKTRVILWDRDKLEELLSINRAHGNNFRYNVIIVREKGPRRGEANTYVYVDGNRQDPDLDNSILLNLSQGKHVIYFQRAALKSKKLEFTVHAFQKYKVHVVPKMFSIDAEIEEI